MPSFDELVKGKPEIFRVSENLRLRKVPEFSFDDVKPPFNTLVMWEPPIKGFTYTIGVDPSYGIGLDRSVIHVMRDGTLRSVDTQVAEFVTNDINMHDLTPYCNMLGQMYKDPIEELEALMAVECNLSDTIVYDLRNKYNYTNQFIWKVYDNITHVFQNRLGWYTTPRTRPKIINKAMQYVAHGWWDISSPWLIAEMETIEKSDDKAQIAAAEGFHDDIFMAGAIALWAAHDLEFGEQSAEGLELAAEREKRAAQRIVGEFTPQRTGSRKDYQNTAITYKQMMAEEDDYDTD